ncbi:DNA-directed RNA polymerase II subunit RPB1 [Drosophila busckii]|uniref:DNA-directed RNA polymerase II subunit RPB1 n=1 Tax=Drosophila busckii TaxID=30019 RepID=UPI00083F05CD|nr:DNA-directed RNA polymerase II subunit RPB1 [Drosophila busckii]
MRCSNICLGLLLALTVGLSHATHYTRDESSDGTNTEYNLASTLSGHITTNRHNAREHLDLTQQPSQQAVDIDDESAAHERGGAAGHHVRVSQPPTLGYPAGSAAVPRLYPSLPVSGAQPTQFGGVSPALPSGVDASSLYPSKTLVQQPVLGVYPSFPSNTPAQQPGVAGASFYPSFPGNNPLQQPGVGAAGVYPANIPLQQPYIPGYPAGYPGQYLPQYPAYPAYAPPPPISYQNQQHYGPQGDIRGRERTDHSFRMNTEYKENGVHKGPFGVLNNHSNQGYGSGFGGGYNGVYNRPGY